MPATMTARAAQRAAEKYLSQGGGSVLADLSEGLRDERWGRSWAQAMAQPFRGMTVGELYAFGRITGMLNTGAVARIRIEVGEAPLGDKAREANAAALSDIAEPFVADLDVRQRTAHCDGCLRWTEPIFLNRTVGDDTNVRVPVGLPDSEYGVPLEVGTCAPSTILMHLLTAGWVARWGYGSDEVWLLVGWPTRGDFIAQNNGAHLHAAEMRLSGV